MVIIPLRLPAIHTSAHSQILWMTDESTYISCTKFLQHYKNYSKNLLHKGYSNSLSKLHKDTH